MFDLHNRVAVVTGGSAGIGKGMAIALARQGADLAILARRADKLEEAAADLRTFGVRVLPVQCDVTSLESVEAACAKVLEYYGKVDILINNAGTGGPSIPTIDMPEETYTRIVNLDLIGVFRVLKTFARPMVEAGYGRIINIASVMGLVGDMEVCLSGYTSAKGGVINLTRGCAAEFAPKGITVNAICPGTFPSESNSPEFIEETTKFLKTHVPMRRPATPTDLNTVGDMDAAIVFLASEEARYVTGVILPVDGGWTCV